MLYSQQISDLLEEAAKSLDIPAHAYEDAVLKYEDVGEFLSEEGSSLLPYSPEVYSQGSFRLGTVVRPLSGGGYDIDLVCRLNRAKEAVTQEALKDSVGERLSEREDLKKILVSARRCWVLEYPDQTGKPEFHMDILPAIPNIEKRPSGILLTDTELRLWQKSNPVGYSEWFFDRMSGAFQARRSTVATDMVCEAEEVPEWQVKTPLQRVVQLLKRHRDVCFDEKSSGIQHPDNKPISIIITTLAAEIYNNELDLDQALENITSGMKDRIHRGSDGKWRVENPVDADENFADKWHDHPERKDAFFWWLDRLRADFSSLRQRETVSEAFDSLKGILGPEIENGLALVPINSSNNHIAVSRKNEPLVPSLGDTSHALNPNSLFTMPGHLHYKAGIRTTMHRSQGRWGNAGRKLRVTRSGDTVPKNIWLNFKLTTEYPYEHSVRWQITNTGDVAQERKQLRGDFYDSNIGSFVRSERTEFEGSHLVQAFVLDENGTCVARSEKYLVKIR